jgi:hypothetical protein
VVLVRLHVPLAKPDTSLQKLVQPPVKCVLTALPVSSVLRVAITVKLVSTLLAERPSAPTVALESTLVQEPRCVPPVQPENSLALQVWLHAPSVLLESILVPVPLFAPNVLVELINQPLVKRNV